MDVGIALSPEKRAQILSGAAAVFAADGYEGASMARITAAAGVSKGTLYNYFDSKAALFTAIINETCERNLARVFDRVDHDGDPAAVLRSIGKRMVQMMLSEQGLAIYRMVIAEAAKFPDLARGFFEAGPARVIGFLADWLTVVIPAWPVARTSETLTIMRRTFLPLLSYPGCSENQPAKEALCRSGPNAIRRHRNVWSEHDHRA